MEALSGEIDALWGLAHETTFLASLAVGFLLKIVDDHVDDGLYPTPVACAAQVGLVALVYPGMLVDPRAACMMAAFTICCAETGGLDTRYFRACAAAVAAALVVSWGVLHPEAAIDFHLHMTLLGTAYAGILATRVDTVVERRYGRGAKALFRGVLGTGVACHRPFVPDDALGQHSLLSGFIAGYFAGQVMALAALRLQPRRRT
eukprot:TRINITY_DN4424_c0_g1_i1.p1 TRINITY_DN4424_c0_g1~~TRINITY_DN4424_c0_g1_i1.p1  ORF type:complete len:204 (+),score=46.17 TRINITY_DN4424_c0_g1_i1:81-692(+)